MVLSIYRGRPLICNKGGYLGTFYRFIVFIFKMVNQGTPLCKSVNMWSVPFMSTGKYLQIPFNSTSADLYCEQGVHQNLAEFEIKPAMNSFKMRGPFHL